MRKRGLGYRKKAWKYLPHYCDKCKSKEKLEVHHKDSNRKNNKLSNLQILCSECHRKIEGRGKPRQSVSQKGSNGKFAKGTKRWKKK